MLINRSPGIRSSEITPESVYRSRREFLRTAAAGAVGACLINRSHCYLPVQIG
jgi:sulfoxide reductase catalytic subunit YedY